MVPRAEEEEEQEDGFGYGPNRTIGGSLTGTELFYRLCVHASMLVVTFHYAFAGCYHWANG